MKKPRRDDGPPSPAPADPLIDEVRRIRAEISEAHDHDLGKLCESLRELEAEYGGKVVHKEGRRSSA